MRVKPRPFAEVRRMLLERAEQRRHPFMYLGMPDAKAALDNIVSTSPESWVAGFAGVAHRYEERASAAKRNGDLRGAGGMHLLAYDAWHLARFPAANSPLRRGAYDQAKANYHLALSCLGIAVEACAIPLLSSEGIVPAYLRVPEGPGPHPVLVMWGGIDTFKEEIERRADPFVARGIAVLAVDMPGVGDAPMLGQDGARQWFGSVLEWLATRPDLSTERCAAMGLSTGGYWATLVAHEYADRLRGVVNHGGCAHHAFTPKWIAKAQSSEYLFDLAETLASAFGGHTYEDWERISPSLSLLTKGTLEKPCAPLLCVNGLQDSVFPIADMYLLLEYGSPKTMRLFPGGHMGYTPLTLPTIVSWLLDRLA